MLGPGRGDAVGITPAVRPTPPDARLQEADAVTQTPPTAQPWTGRPPLRRAVSGRMLGGVCAGIANHLDVDVVIVRLVVVLLTILTSGFGVLAYLVAWLVVPAADSEDGEAPSSRVGEGDPMFWLGVGLLVVGVLWLLSSPVSGVAFTPFGSLGQLVVPLVLIGFGLALWRSGDRPDAQPAPTGSATAGPTPSGSSPGEASPGHREWSPADQDAPARPTHWTYPASAAAGPPPPPSGPGATPPPSGSPGGGWTPPPVDPPSSGSSGGGWTPPPVTPRQPSPLTRWTLGIALVVAGVLWALRVADVVTLTVTTILAAALLVIGAGLLVGSVLGRGRMLILAGVVLAPLVIIGQAAPFTAIPGGVWSIDADHAGELRRAPTTLAELDPSYRLAAGTVRLDLTGLDLSGQAADLEVEVGAGRIRIIVPDDVEVHATASSGVGTVRLFGERTAGGLGAGPVEASYEPDDPRGRIDLDLATGVGEIRVDVGAAPEAGDELDEASGSAAGRATAAASPATAAASPAAMSDGPVMTAAGRATTKEAR